MLSDLTPPAHLADRSAAVWNELAPMLRRLQVLTEADVIGGVNWCVVQDGTDGILVDDGDWYEAVKAVAEVESRGADPI